MSRVAVLAGLVAVRAAAAGEARADRGGTFRLLDFCVTNFMATWPLRQRLAGRFNILPVSDRPLLATDATPRVAKGKSGNCVS